MTRKVNSGQGTAASRDASQCVSAKRTGTPAKHVKGAIAPRQIKAIHAAKGKLGMDDDTYRDTLRERFGVESCKGLTWGQAEELLDALNSGTGNQGRGTGKGRSPVPGPRSLPFTDFDGRPGFATGAQCRLIAAMWAQVSRAENDEAREKALNSFCYRIVGVSGLRMVKGWQVEKIVKALEKMGAVKQELGTRNRGPGKTTTEETICCDESHDASGR